MLCQAPIPFRAWMLASGLFLLLFLCLRGGRNVLLVWQSSTLAYFGLVLFLHVKYRVFMPKGKGLHVHLVCFLSHEHLFCLFCKFQWFPYFHFTLRSPEGPDIFEVYKVFSFNMNGACGSGIFLQALCLSFTRTPRPSRWW